MKSLFTGILILFMLLGLSIESQAQTKGTFIDLRDNQSYKIIEINGTTWMAENLNIKTNYSYCYNDQMSNCEKYGRLYTWKAAKKACPDGWHLATAEDWLLVLRQFGYEGYSLSLEDASEASMKLAYNNLTKDGKSGLDILTGSGHKRNTNYLQPDVFWSGTDQLKFINIIFDKTGVSGEERTAHFYNGLMNGEDDALEYASCRCVKNKVVDDGKLFTDKRDQEQYKTINIKGIRWMAENLNFEIDNSNCYNDQMSNCEKYGRLYTWEAAKEACPDGWRLPTIEEMKGLLTYYGSYYCNLKKKIIYEGNLAEITLEYSGSSGFNLLFGGAHHGSIYTPTRTAQDPADTGHGYLLAGNPTSNKWGYIVVDRTGGPNWIDGGQDEADAKFSCRCVQDIPRYTQQAKPSFWHYMGPKPAGPIYALGDKHADGGFVVYISDGGRTGLVASTIHPLSTIEAAVKNSPPGWRLPTADESKYISKNYNKSGTDLGHWTTKYWTSECDGNWCKIYGSAGLDSINKTWHPLKVIYVKKF